MPPFTSLTNTKLITLLQSGAVGVLPTDTVYGLVCRAADKTAVARLYALKHRENKPGTIIAAKPQQLIDLGLRGRYVKAVQDFWPNPLSVVIPCDDTLAYLHLGKYSLAVRVPEDEVLLELLAKTGPLLTSSANLPGQPTAKTVEEARAYFSGQPDFYVDSGLIDNPPSTVICIVDDAIEVLRPGALHIDEQGRIQR